MLGLMKIGKSWENVIVQKMTRTKCSGILGETARPIHLDSSCHPSVFKDKGSLFP